VGEYAVPILPSRDLHETMAFYERLGFEARTTWLEGFGYLVLTRGPVELHFWLAPDVDARAIKSSCYVHVPDADVLCRAWEEAGVPVASQPVDTPWRQREFAISDPSGNVLRVGSPLPH
jgi:predicted enzyme related to lactoylglutathione lyase